ncbi:MAG: glycosyltransferase family 2 protein [Bradyrhizobium sp.]|jgi:succinoglycan biosynthesis protein ExoM|nr:MAG: glycosyltransferase family 2 protein [Bradyrhizobium sp.]
MAARMPTRASRDGEISVLIPTHRRPASLERLLNSLVGQKDASPFDVIVVDNDAAQSGEGVVARFLDRLAITYLTEPVRGLARVRNRAVAAASSRFIAFVDDDEWAAPDWLVTLVSMAKRTGADAVMGAVQPVFADAVPDFIRSCGLFEDLPFGDGEILPWYATRTGNALVRREALPHLRAPFSSRLDFVGGEDVQMFKQMIERGARIVSARHAVVFEERPVDRINLRWVVRRALRNGGTIVDLLWDDGGGFKTRSGRALRAGGEAIREAARVGALWNRDRTRAMRHLVAACQEAGMVLRVAGFRVEEYRKHP